MVRPYISTQKNWMTPVPDIQPEVSDKLRCPSKTQPKYFVCQNFLELIL